MKAAQVAFVGHLAHVVTSIAPVLQEHLDDNDGVVLPHIVMADIERWAESVVQANSDDLAVLLNELEAAFASGDEDVTELIAVSFLEHIPRAPEPGHQLRGLLGPTLREQLDVIG